MGGGETNPPALGLHLSLLRLPARETIGGRGRQCTVRARPGPLPSRPGSPRTGPRKREGRKEGRGTEAVSPPAGLRDHPALGVGARLLRPSPRSRTQSAGGPGRPGAAVVGSGAGESRRQQGERLTMKSRAKLSSPLWSGLFMAWTLWINFLRISTCSILPRPPGCGGWPPRRRPPARRRARSVFPSSLPQPFPSLSTPAKPRRSLLLPTA